MIEISPYIFSLQKALIPLKIGNKERRRELIKSDRETAMPVLNFPIRYLKNGKKLNSSNKISPKLNCRLSAMFVSLHSEAIGVRYAPPYFKVKMFKYGILVSAL